MYTRQAVDTAFGYEVRVKGKVIPEMVFDEKTLKYKWKMSALPFGTRLPNGGTFGKSVFDPESSLVRVLRYLDEYGPSTKRQLCVGVFNFMIENGGKRRAFRFSEDSTQLNKRNLSGWRSPFFRGMVDAGFVHLDKTGYCGKGRWKYHLTRLGKATAKLHDTIPLPRQLESYYPFIGR